MANNYIYFWSEKTKNGYLSNWYDSPFVSEGKTFQNSEQYFMYQKAVLFNDMEAAKKIMEAETPKEYKKLGRTVQGFNSEIWEQNRENVMFDGVLLKFCQNEDLKQKLLATGDAVLVEASPYDRIWGIGMRKADAEKISPENWKGLNLLGKVLMKVRETIKKDIH